MEANNLPGKEFKTLAIRILSELSEDINKEILSKRTCQK